MEQLAAYKKLILPILKRFNVKHAAIFGSVAKGIANETSDIDLLIEPSKGFTLFNMLQLENEINTLTNRKIDIVEYTALKTSIRAEVLETAITIL